MLARAIRFLKLELMPTVLMADGAITVEGIAVRSRLSGEKEAYSAKQNSTCCDFIAK